MSATSEPTTGAEVIVDREGDEASLIKAMSHPLRMRIMTRIEGRVASPRELARELNRPLNVVSYHVRILADLGLLRLVEEKQRRGAVEHYYEVTARWAVPEGAWAHLPGRVQDHLLRGALAQISQDLAAAGFRRPEHRLSRSRMDLDEQGLLELSGLVGRMLHEADGIVAASRDRIAAGTDPLARLTGLTVMLYDLDPGQVAEVDPQAPPADAAPAGTAPAPAAGTPGEPPVE